MKKDEKHQPDDLRPSINDSKHFVCDSKHSNCQPDDSHHSIIQHLWRRLKKSMLARLKNIILGQLKMGECQATF